MTSLVARPDEFFRRKLEERRIREPLLVVLAAGAAKIFSALVTVSQFKSRLPEQAERFLFVGQVVGAVIGVITVVGLWVIFSGLFHLISNYFDGEGEFRDLMRLTGYGFLPEIFSGIVTALVTYYALQGVAFPEDPRKMQAFLRELHHGPVFLLSGVLGIAFTVWRGVLWTFAVKHARNLTFRQATVTVWGPLGIVLLGNLYTLL